MTVALLLLGALHSSWGFWVPPTAGTQALRCFTPGHRAVCKTTASRLSMSGEDAGEGEHVQRAPSWATKKTKRNGDPEICLRPLVGAIDAHMRFVRKQHERVGGRHAGGEERKRQREGKKKKDKDKESDGEERRWNARLAVFDLPFATSNLLASLSPCVRPPPASRCYTHAHTWTQSLSTECSKPTTARCRVPCPSCS